MGDLTARFTALLGETSLLAIPIAFVIGLASSLTPCVYPLVPIIVSYMGNQAGKSRLRSFLMSVLYVVGMAVTFAALGVIAGLTGQIFGDISHNPWVNIAVGLVIIFFALVLVGVVKLPMPRFLQGQGGSARRGYLGAFLMGLTSGMISGSCTVAIVTPLIAYVTTQGSVFFGALTLFSFAMGMGVLLIVVGTFTGVVSALPKAGPWIRKVEIAFGALMIAVAVGYFIIYRPMQAFGMSEEVARAEGVTVEGQVTPLQWVGSTAPEFTAPDLEGRAVVLKDELAKRPVVLVFWATWCPACVAEVPHLIKLHAEYGDRATFIGVATKDRLDRIKTFVQDSAVPYTIAHDPGAQLARAYGFNGIPSVVLIDRGGKIVFEGSTDTAALEAALKTLLEGGSGGPAKADGE